MFAATVYLIKYKQSFDMLSFSASKMHKNLQFYQGFLSPFYRESLFHSKAVLVGYCVGDLIF